MNYLYVMDTNVKPRFKVGVSNNPKAGVDEKLREQFKHNTEKIKLCQIIMAKRNVKMLMMLNCKLIFI